jgi:hypothetical protein
MPPAGAGSGQSEPVDFLYDWSVATLSANFRLTLMRMRKQRALLVFIVAAFMYRAATQQAGAAAGTDPRAIPDGN